MRPGTKSEIRGSLKDAISPWLQDVDEDGNRLSDVWREEWQITYRDVVILNAANEIAGGFTI